MSNQTDGENVVHHSPIVSFRPEMGENSLAMTSSNILDFMKKVTFFSVGYINDHKFTHSITLMCRENLFSLFCLFRSYLDTTLLVKVDKN